MQPDLRTIAMGSRGTELYFSAPRSVTELVLSVGAQSEEKGRCYCLHFGSAIILLRGKMPYF